MNIANIVFKALEASVCFISTTRQLFLTDNFRLR